MSKKRRYLVFVFCGIGLALTGAAWLVNFTRLQRLQPSPPTASQRVSQFKLFLRREFARCGHFVEEQKSMGKGDIELIGGLYKGWQIGQGQGDGMTLISNDEGYCPICEQEEFLGVLDGKVAVFYGRPERRGPIKEVTVLDVKSLPQQEQFDLAKGLIIKTDKEKLQLIEGLTSLQDG